MKKKRRERKPDNKNHEKLPNTGVYRPTLKA